MKIQIHSDKDNLIHDSNENDYCQYIQGVKPDIVWSLSSYSWKTLGTSTLKNNKIFFSVIISDKPRFSREDFLFRDNFAEAYHVIDKKTKDKIEKLTFKPVHLIPYDIDENDTFEESIIENFKTSTTFSKAILDVFKEIVE